MDRFITRTEEYIREGNLLGKGGRLVAGISGGVDSVCLLEVLDTLRAKWDWDVTAVHIHHGIRGESADEDMEFVRMLCRAKKIDCHVHRVDVPAVARERGLGEEEAGRIVRREILESELAGRGRIVLAHHADDNAETLLLNLCRGSGLYG
ncbi:MAG: tRNA lysidine(34) synthetase TilS, partial [Lachnospiraceae bacterium]|nr:tRNA lysidine(34) synthetase TilS [Lachnospiraceae bacterium]